jgi:hypothetical protein
MQSPESNDRKMAEMAMSWYGWGSPIGLGALILCIALSVWALASSVAALENAWSRPMSVATAGK